MKKNKKNKQKRIEMKRMKRDKRKRNSCHGPQIEWLSDKEFAMHFDDKNINALFSSIMIQKIDKEDEMFSVDMRFQDRDMSGLVR